MASLQQRLSRVLGGALCIGAVIGAARAQQPSTPDPALVILPIPDRTEDMVTQLKTRDSQVGELIAKGNFAAVYVPAFQAKDLAIALEGRLNSIPEARRESAVPAIREIVRLAWLIDAAGDAGNRRDLVTAHTAFSSEIALLVAAFGG